MSIFLVTRCHSREAHVVANSQRGGEALSPTAHKELNDVKNLISMERDPGLQPM